MRRSLTFPSGASPGLYVEDFDRTRPRSGWTDWADVAPDDFDRMAVVAEGGARALTPSGVPVTDTTYGWNNTEYSDGISQGFLTHGLIGRPVGQPLGYEITVRWWKPGLFDWLHQVGPAVMLDPDAPAGNTLGLCNWWDSGILRFYCCDVFQLGLGHNHLVDANLWDPDAGGATHLYDMNMPLVAAGRNYVYGLDINTGEPVAESTHPTYMDMTIRVGIDGKLEGLVDGMRTWGPIDIPETYLGRDCVGANLLGIGPVKGTVHPFFGGPDVSPDGGVVDRFYKAMIRSVRIRSWAAPLGDYPTVTPTAGTAIRTATAAGSINVPYPPGVQPDDVLMILAANGGGAALDVPSGWTAAAGLNGRATNALSAQLRAFVRAADAADVAAAAASGTVTVAKQSGTALLGGVMVRLPGAHPYALPSGKALGNAASTAPASDVVQVIGPHRTVVWAAACAADVALTLPAGHTSLANLRTSLGSGVALNMAAGWAAHSPAPGISGDSTVGPLTGTAGSAVDSAVLAAVVTPDPS